jgi:hypothetical protein
MGTNPLNALLIGGLDFKPGAVSYTV